MFQMPFKEASPKVNAVRIPERGFKAFSHTFLHQENSHTLYVYLSFFPSRICEAEQTQPEIDIRHNFPFFSLTESLPFLRIRIPLPSITATALPP